MNTILKIVSVNYLSKNLLYCMCKNTFNSEWGHCKKNFYDTYADKGQINDQKEITSSGHK